MKRSYQKRPVVLQERSDVDAHSEFNPEDLGLEDWGEGFHVQAEPVLIERHTDGRIARTTPLSEAHRQGKFLKLADEAAADAVEVPGRAPSPIFNQEKVVDILAAYMMAHFARFGPNQLPYNPLYDGIPLSESVASNLILEPGKSQAVLTHVPAHEVHEWLRKVIGKRAQLRNAKTGRQGWSGDINTTMVTFNR